MSAYPAIQEMQTQFQTELEALGSSPDLRAVEDFKVKFLGKKGLITGLMKQMGSLSNEERPAFGKEVNILKKNWFLNDLHVCGANKFKTRTGFCLFCW